MWKTIQMNYTRVAESIQYVVDGYRGEGDVQIGVAESTLFLYVNGREMPIAEVHEMSGGHVSIDFDPDLFEFDETYPMTELNAEVSE